MMPKSNIAILLLEDDPNLGLMIKEHLEMNGYNVDLRTNGRDGINAFDRGSFDLCLVDIMMPIMDGFSFAREVRNRNDTIPLIFLTAKSLQEDKIEGFKIGCDDYITKPFSVEELLLRLRAVLKRLHHGPDESGQCQFDIGLFSFDSKNQILSGPDGETKLTSKESELLKLLCLKENKILERNIALKCIWGNENYFSGRSMDVFISKLRKYLKADSNVEISNVHGKGYKLIINS